MRKYLLEDINYITQRLGTTTPHLWPFVEFEGTNVVGYSSAGDLTSAETAGAAEALEDDFEPLLLPCGLYAYWFNPTGDHHLSGSDHADLTFGDATVDSPFSVGAWIFPLQIAGANAIMAKYDSAGALREWAFRITANGELSLELYDESADTTEIALSRVDVERLKWQFVVATYDGGETAPVVRLYVDAKDISQDTAGATTETGAYVAMENTAAPLTIGCSGVTATPVAEFYGYVALPFVTGKALTAAEVEELFTKTRQMVLGSA